MQNRGKLPFSWQFTLFVVSSSIAVGICSSLAFGNRKPLTIAQKGFLHDKERMISSVLINEKMTDRIRKSAVGRLLIKFLLLLTPDRGKEFACHEEITQETGIEFYFPRPHSPWDRGTNENTNGLLREYIPKSTDIDALSEEEIAAFFDKLNKRPRKCLGWKTPFEVFYNIALHLV